MDIKTLTNLLHGVENTRVLIIGDLIIDKYIQGSKVKISPEAPVPAVNGKITKWETYGGAGNVAASVKRLGGDPLLVSLTGVQEHERDMPTWVNVFTNRTPPTKTRVVCNGHHICRYDEEKIEHMSQVQAALVEQLVCNLLNKFDPDAIVIADYGKSGLTRKIVHDILNTIDLHGDRVNKKYVVTIDSKTPYRVGSADEDLPYSNVELVITPNREEWGEYVSRHGTTCNTVVTLGEGGLEYISFSNTAKIINPFSHPTVLDVCGAGDTVTATCGLLLKAFEPYKDRLEKLKVAQFVAETSVQKFGVNPPFKSEVIDYANKAFGQA